MPRHREKDTRRIVSGVHLYEGRNVLTFVAGQEEALEAKLTPGTRAHLLAEGAIEGDWDADAAPPAPAPRSKARAEAGTDADRLEEVAKFHDDLRKEAAEKRLAAKQEAAAAAEGEEGPKRSRGRKAEGEAGE
jgi:hypothetical protein